MPEPRAAVTSLAEAVKRRDAQAVHAMLDEQSRRGVTVAELQELLDRDGTEIGAVLDAQSERDVAVDAEVVLQGGEQVRVTQTAGSYYVADTSGLVGVAVTPHEAIVGLRRALEQADYDVLLQLLASDVRQAVEGRRLELVQALEDIEVMHIVVRGERAVVNTADGHRIELELESGVWRVRDFE